MFITINVVVLKNTSALVKLLQCLKMILVEINVMQTDLF